MVSGILDRGPQKAEDLNMGKLLTGLAGVTLLFTVMTRAFAEEHKANDPFLPPGEGRDKVMAVCTSCHGARAFGQLRYEASGWRYHVKEMILHGAQVKPDDVEPIVSYLSKAFGPGVPLPTPSPAEVTLAEGPGKELVEGTCALCHGLDRVTAVRRNPDEWNRIVKQMVFYGAPLSGDDMKMVTTYLKQHFKKQ